MIAPMADDTPEPEETPQGDDAAAAEATEEAPQEEYTYEILHGKTVNDLRDIAQRLEHDALHGYSTMHKEQLLPALCEALGIEAHEHHEVVGIDKKAVKAQIRELKQERQQALESGDRKRVKIARRRIRRLKRKIRRATV